MTVKSLFTCLHRDAKLPFYATAEAAGADVYSIETFIIEPTERRLVRTGLGCRIPMGYELQVRPRSGLAFKSGVSVLNSPGTIDSDYQGELMILLINHGEDNVIVEKFDRIAQIVMAPVVQAAFDWFEGEAKETGRSSAGFGSTGRK